MATELSKALKVEVNAATIAANISPNKPVGINSITNLGYTISFFGKSGNKCFPITAGKIMMKINDTVKKPTNKIPFLP